MIQQGEGDRDPEAAASDAVVLIDEINERAASRQFYGIDQTLHAKLCTIRATIARALAVEAYRLENHRRPTSDFAELRGKNLACWCALANADGFDRAE